MTQARLSITLPEGVWIRAVSTEHPDADFRVLAVMPGEDAGFGLVRIAGPEISSILAGMEAAEDLTSVSMLRRKEEQALVQFETTQPLLLRPLQASRMPIEPPVEIQDGVGRPHIARAIDAHPDTDLSYQDAFDELIADDGPCFVPREVPSFETGLELLSEACGIVSLAHPYRYEAFKGVLELAPRLDAVECRYPYSDSNTASRSDLDVRTVERHDLLITSGSDAHGKQLGKAGLTEPEYERLRDVGGFSV